MKKILIATLAAAAAIAANSASAEQILLPPVNGPFGIECVRWDMKAYQIHCAPHPWNTREPDVITFANVQDIYDHGYRVVTMTNVADEHGGQYGYADFIIEKR